MGNYGIFIFADFSVSPQGSLDHTIEEDCFTATNHKSGKSEQQMVSQSSPVGTIVEKHARSLPNIETFETNFTVSLNVTNTELQTQNTEIFSPRIVACIHNGQSIKKGCSKDIK